jgi:hypothetical protein
MAVPVIKVQSNVRQPIISHSTTGLNASRVPEAQGAVHVRAPLARLKQSTQPVTAIPGQIAYAGVAGTRPPGN